MNSPVKVHISCIQVFTILNKTDTNFMSWSLYGHKLSSLWDKYQEAQLLDHMKRVYLPLLETGKLSSKVTVLHACQQ